MEVALTLKGTSGQDSQSKHHSYLSCLAIEVLAGQLIVSSSASQLVREVEESTGTGSHVHETVQTWKHLWRQAHQKEDQKRPTSACEEAEPGQKEVSLNDDYISSSWHCF